MKLTITILFLLSSSLAIASDHSHDHMNHSDMMHHSHEGHLHEELVDGQKLEVDPERFDRFVSNLTDAQVAVVSVKGMVCDFCARGIEKTFQKDKNVKKIDVDLSKGKVLVAFDKNAAINFEDIKKKILANGQNATGIQVLSI
jgi:copper chaperone CopZ